MVDFESDFVFLVTFITELNELISSTKTLYFKSLVKKLNNSLLQAKTYCSILKTFYNNKKILLVLLLLIDNRLLIDIKRKSSFFNSFFHEQNTPFNNDSALPTNQILST